MWSLFSRDPTVHFSYEVGAEVEGVFGRSFWHLNAGKNKTSGEQVSIFVLDLKTADEIQASLARKCVKRFKTLRHPSVVRYVDELETDKVIYLVTEYVIPLEVYVRDYTDDGSNSDSAMAWGIHQVVAGIGFLNDANLVHNNLCMSSIFVDISGEWKIGGLEYMCASTDPAPKLPYNLQMYEPPEVSRGGNLAQKQPTARDLWGIGCLIWEAFNGTLSKQTQLKAVGKMNKALVPNYCELVSANPKSRPVPSKFLQDCQNQGGFLSNDFVKTMILMEEIEIKDQNEKTRFFDHLSKQLDKFPKPACTGKILPKLLKAYEFGGAGSSILSPILKIGKYLDDAEYQTKIVPCVVKLFSSPDRATRVKLLQQLDVFAAHLQPKIVNDQIFPSIVPGFMDTNPLVRENTIKAMIHLAPKLGFKQLNEETMRHFARLQSKDPEGGIRTNTTICLGKIACYLNPQMRQKILISAFTRGVRDPCRPARLASIQAMAATQRFYTVQDIGTRLMPVLVSLTVDSDPSIREAVFKVIKVFLANLEKVSENPELQTEMEKDVLSSNTEAYDDSWAGWAMSLTSKLYKNRDKNSPQKTSTTTDTSLSEPSAKRAQPALVSNQKPAVMDDNDNNDVGNDGWDAWNDDEEDDFGDAMSANITTTVNSTKYAGTNKESDRMTNLMEKTSINDGGDGWGDGDDWGDMDDVDDMTRSNQENFKPADPDLPTSSSYSWDNDDDFLSMESTGSNQFTNSEDDFFSAAMMNPKSKPGLRSTRTTSNTVRTRETKPRNTTPPAQSSKFAVQSTGDDNDDDDWSNDAWESFDEPKRERKPPAKSRLKLGGKKIGQD